MHNKLLYYIATLCGYVALCMLAFASCQSDSSSESKEALDAIIGSTYFNESGGTTSIYIKSKGLWTIQSKDTAWLSLSASDGAGNDTVMLFCKPNTTDIHRFSQVDVISGPHRKTLYIDQQKRLNIVHASGERFFEMPKDTAMANCLTITRFLTGSRANMRNYTMLYDTQMRVAHWVAYPLTSGYLGATKRTDDWQYDPLVKMEYQPELFVAYRGGYSRGHQLPSADRTYSADENRTTFYFTNMTPQNYVLNSGIWADLEAKIRTWARHSSVDTLFVVTGAMLQTATDKTIEYTRDSRGMSVAIPKYFYKALAQKRGSTYHTIAFKMKNTTPNQYDSFKNYSLSVSQLEVETGFTYFPTLPAETKKNINTDIWSY